MDKVKGLRINNIYRYSNVGDIFGSSGIEKIMLTDKHFTRLHFETPNVLLRKSFNSALPLTFENFPQAVLNGLENFESFSLFFPDSGRTMFFARPF